MERFPALKFVVTYGPWGAYVVSIVVAVLVVWLGWAAAGWLIVLVGVLAAGLSYIAIKSFVELVIIITEMLLPQ